MVIRNIFYRKYGFGMVELLIIVGLLSILIPGMIVLINPMARIAQANDAKRKSDIVNIKRALEIYYNDNDRYPASTATFTITGTSWGGSWNPYISRLPGDPSSSRRYVYYTPSSGSCANYQCFYIFANLERGGNDPHSCFPGTGNACANAAANGLSNSCGGICNYGSSSPNTAP